MLGDLSQSHMKFSGRKDHRAGEGGIRSFLPPHGKTNFDSVLQKGNQYIRFIYLNRKLSLSIGDDRHDQIRQQAGSVLKQQMSPALPLRLLVWEKGSTGVITVAGHRSGA